jgi:phosphinothricin acetyltransferase
METIQIVPMDSPMWHDVARIYESGIATKNATFQTEAPTWDAWDKAHRPDCRLVATINNQIVGWAALSPVSARQVYAGVAEVSIYIDSEFRGKKVGDTLMKALVNESEAKGIWSLQAGIFPENEASIRLHENNGFRVLGVKERIGKMDEKWRDVTMLERRSKVTGIH